MSRLNNFVVLLVKQQSVQFQVAPNRAGLMSIIQVAPYQIQNAPNRLLKIQILRHIPQIYQSK